MKLNYLTTCKWFQGDIPGSINLISFYHLEPGLPRNQCIQSVSKWPLGVFKPGNHY